MQYSGRKAIAVILWAIGCPAVSHAAAFAVTYDTVALTGDAAPGTAPGVSFDGFIFAPVVNNAGQTAFRATLTGAGVDATNDLAVFSGAGGGLGLRARTGDAVPGTGAGVSFGDFVNVPVLNDAGQVAFLGSLAGAGVDDTNDLGVFSTSGGGLGLVARNGDSAPGTGPGVNFINVGGGVIPSTRRSPLLNNAGQVAFGAALTGVGVENSSNDFGIFSDVGGGLELIAREADAVPSLGPGVNFSNLDGSDLNDGPVLNDAGQIAFRGNLSGTGIDSSNNSGIFSASGGTVELPIRDGDAAPGTEAGVTFGDFGPVSTVSPVLNDAGQIAFRASLRGTGVDGTNGSGIFIQSGSTSRLIARAGDAAPGTEAGVSFGTLSGFGVLSPDTLVLNNAEQTVFSAFLTGPGVDGFNSTGLFAESGGTVRLIARAGDAAPGTEAGVSFRSVGRPLLNDAGLLAIFTRLDDGGPIITNDSGIFATDLDGELQLILRTGDLFDVDDDPLTADLRTIGNIGLVTGSGGSDGRPTSLNDHGQLALQLTFTDGTSGIFLASLALSLTGDYNGDGFVGQSDLDLVLLNWGDGVLPDGFDAAAVPGGGPFDGLIGQNELDGVLLNWGNGTPAPGSANAIPEPGALVLLAGVGGLAWRRRGGG